MLPQLRNINIDNFRKVFDNNNSIDVPVELFKHIMEGYNELIKSPRIMCDVDFMLYLSRGTLLKQMEKDCATFRIVLLKPDYENLAIKDNPLTLTSFELKQLINK